MTAQDPTARESRPSRRGRASRERLLERFRILRLVRSSRVPDDDPAEDAAVRRRLGFSFWLAVAWLLIMAFVAVFAPMLPVADPTKVAFGGPREPPSTDAWFGTDALGRDVFSRTMHGARISLAVGGFAIVFGMVVGGSLGIVAGYFRGRLDQAVGFAFFVLLSFPSLVLAILITATLDRSLLVVSLTIGILAVAPVGLLAPGLHPGVRRAGVRGRGPGARRPPRPHHRARAAAQRGHPHGGADPARHGHRRGGRGLARPSWACRWPGRTPSRGAR